MLSDILNSLKHVDSSHSIKTVQYSYIVAARTAVTEVQ